MNIVYDFITEKLYNTDNEDIISLLTQKKDVKKRSINIVIFFIFVVLIGIYSTLNLLMMFFTLLLFLYWIAQVEFLSYKRQFKDKETRSDLYYNKAQMLLRRGKSKECLSMYQKYQMKSESIENMKLYFIALFMEKKFQTITEIFDDKIHVENEFITMYKHALHIEGKHQKLMPLLDERNIVDLIYLIEIKKEDNKKYIDLFNSIDQNPFRKKMDF
jgi:Ca2+/Na+ antiporter